MGIKSLFLFSLFLGAIFCLRSSEPVDIKTGEDVKLETLGDDTLVFSNTKPKSTFILKLKKDDKNPTAQYYGCNENTEEGREECAKSSQKLDLSEKTEGDVKSLTGNFNLDPAKNKYGFLDLKVEEELANVTVRVDQTEDKKTSSSMLSSGLLIALFAFLF